VLQTRQIAARWRTLGAALAELGWPWLRLHGELVARRLAYRTHPPGHEIDWSDPKLRVDRAESAVTIVELLPAEIGAVGFGYTTVAVEVFLPVGQRPSTAPAKVSWRDRVPEKALEGAMKDIAQLYDGKPRPTFDAVWTELCRRWPGFPRDAARGAIASYAPQLKRAPGEWGKVKSRS